ncbi:uncharacterized protein LOC144043602 isoform X2 [Vanacampus margaritifer]
MMSSFDVAMDTDTEASLLLPVLVSAAMLACGVVLALVCLHCRDNGPPVSIREASVTGEYIPSTQFRLVHPHQSTTRLTSSLLSPFIPASHRGSQCSRRSNREPTESESNHSYQNSHDGQSPSHTFTEPDFPESLTGDYIIVLPGDEASATNHSGVSTPSSGEPHDYENVLHKRTPSPTDEREYLNVIPLPQGGETPTLSSQSDEDDDDSDDDDEGKYVNQASVMSSSPLHDGTGRALAEFDR